MLTLHTSWQYHPFQYSNDNTKFLMITFKIPDLSVGSNGLYKQPLPYGLHEIPTSISEIIVPPINLTRPAERIGHCSHSEVNASRRICESYQTETYTVPGSKYKYIDKDISRTLSIRLDQERLREWNNVFISAPIAEKENKLIKFLNDEKTNNVRYSNRTLLTPYLTGKNDDGHWVGVVVKFENNTVARVEYYDSLDRNDTAKLVKDLQEVYGDKKIVKIQNNYVSFHDNNKIFFPRCEYKVRFKETSAFAMSDPDYWATYFRSTSLGGNCDRIAKLEKSGKTYKNSNINKSGSENKETIPPSKTGCIKSPWVHDEYKNIFYTNPLIPKEINKNNNTLLYDQLLQYKTYICSTVVKEFLALEISDSKIDVYFENDYPCIMVQIKEFAKLSFKTTKEQNSLYKIVIAYFIAITNSVAYNSNVPIELVNRASFGHNIPSVSETAKSFRISIGIVPKYYATVLAKGLELLNTKFLVPLLNKNKTKTTLKLGLSQEEIDCHNTGVTYYNEKKSTKKRHSMVDYWEEDESLFNVLCKVGDSSGRKVSYQITRYNKYIDLLADYAHEQLLYTLDNTKDFAKPLREILKKITYTIKVTVNDTNDDNDRQFEFRVEENQAIKDDNEFWGIIKNISSVFEENLSYVINSQKIKGLNHIIEKANLEFIRNSSGQQSEDGYGSSSDCEVSVEGTSFYSRKITAATGMRAINLAHFLSIYQAGRQKIDMKYMYYETDDVVKYFVQDIYQLRNLNLSVPSGVVKYFDLNHCAAKGPYYKMDPKKIKDNLNSEAVMVLDYTSATSEKISEAIRLFITEVPVLLLVSSGAKNEQVGADMNPYGTLRIIATDLNDLNKLYYILKANIMVKEKLPQELHNIRKAYKDAGAVVTSAAIYTKDRGYDYQPNTTDEDDTNLEYLIKADTWSDELRKIAVLFSSEYDEERYNLNKTHGVNLVEIISWDLEKIKFLGSDRVIDVIDRFDDSQDLQDIFNQITELYDSDHKLTCDIVDEILDSKEDLTDMDFADLVQEYQRIKEECECDENIIDVIVWNDMSNNSDYKVGFAIAKMSGLIDSDCSTPNSSSDDDKMSSYSDVATGYSSNDNSMSSLGEGMDYAA